MKSFIEFYSLSIFCLNLFVSISVPFVQNISSPLCERTKRLHIDSVVAKDENLNETLYYFIGETITVVNFRKKVIEKVEKITVFFNTTDPTHELIPPIDIAFTHRNDTIGRILILMNIKENRHWNISLEDNKILGTSSGLLSNIINSEVLDVININDKKGYIFKKAGARMIYCLLYEWESLLNISLVQYHLRTQSNYTKVGLVDASTDGSKALFKLNDSLIISGVIFANNFKLYANPYSSDMPVNANEVKDFIINDFTDEICNQWSTSQQTTGALIESTTSLTINGTNGTTAPESTDFLIIIIFIVIIVSSVLAVVVVICVLVIKHLSKKNKKSSGTDNSQSLASEAASIYTVSSDTGLRVAKSNIKAEKSKLESDKLSNDFSANGQTIRTIQS